MWFINLEEVDITGVGEVHVEGSVLVLEVITNMTHLDNLNNKKTLSQVLSPSLLSSRGAQEVFGEGRPCALQSGCRYTGFYSLDALAPSHL